MKQPMTNRLQKLITDELSSLAAEHNASVPLAVECDNTAGLDVVAAFRKHYRKHKTTADDLKLLVHTNSAEPLVTLRWHDFKEVLSSLIRLQSPPAAPTPVTRAIGFTSKNKK